MDSTSTASMNKTLIIASGLVFVAVGACLFRRELRLKRSGERVPGIVTAVHESALDTSETLVKFRTRAGQEMEVESHLSDGRQLPAGSEVTVIYDPANPENMTLERDAGRVMLGGLISVVVGLVLIAVGAQ